MRKFLLLFVALALSIGLWAQTQMVSYSFPEYKTAGDPTSGIASWGTALVNATVVTNNTRFLSTGWYVVTGSDVQTAALICNGAANLILADGATLTATGGYPNAGITVSGEGNSLTIYAQSTDPAYMGTLFAIGSPQAAGIGGGQGSNGSNITINGGYVTANAGSTAAGIGGGNGGIGSNITINGGIVTANSGAGAAGIGGGFGSNGSDITINGGTVTANAAPGGAGIGGGNGGNGSGITINDGSVTANSVSAAGIGGGNEGDGSNITINGGTVTANGGSIASGIGGGYAGNGSDITINGGTVTANAGIGAAGIGGGDQSVNITVATTLLVKADGNNPPTTVITNDGSDLAGTLAGKQYVTVEPTVQVTELSYFVAQAIEEAGDADVVYDLDPAIEYTLNTPVVTGTKKVTINGAGRTLVVGSIGQFRIKEDLVLNDINFDCAASTLPLIALDSMKVAADTAYCWNKYGANGKDAFFMENIKLINVNVSGLTTSLIKSEAPWAIRNVSIMNSIVQMNQANIFFTINLQDGGNGMIQNLDVEKSTFYNIVADRGVFIAYNANNPAAKFWSSADANSTWVMKNNTFANIYGDKMGDSYTEQTTNTINWTDNIFYAVGNLSQIRNCTVVSTPADNTTGGTNCGNNTGYATVDSTLVFTVPETNLDLANIDLKANFAPSSVSYAGSHGFGDPRWAPTVSPNLTANFIHVKVGEKQPIAVSSYSKGAITVEILTPALVEIENDSLVALAAGEAKVKITQAALAPFEEGVIDQVKFNIVEATEKPIAETAVGIYRPLFGENTNGYLLGTPSVKTIEGITVTPTLGTNVEYADVPKNDLFDGLKHQVRANDNVFYPSVEKNDIDGESFFGFDIDIPADQPMNIDSLDVLLPVGNAYMWRVQITNEAGDTIWRSAGEVEGKDIKVNGYTTSYCYTNQFIATRDTVKLSEAAAQKLSEWTMALNYSVAASEKLPVLKRVTGKYSVKVYYWGKAKKSLSYEKVFLHLSEDASVTVTVTANVNVDTMGSVSGAGDYDINEEVDLTATPTAHHHFVSWNNGSTDNPTHLLVTKDTTVTATFAIDRHVVTTIVNNIDLGEVSGAGTHDYGETVTLTATPYAHAVFSGWSNGETANPLNFTLEKDTTIIAIFTVDSHVISATVNDETMGSVTGAQTYTHGAMATLTATANEHYHFVNWSNGITANTFSILVEKDSAVIANFEIDRHVVTGVANNAALGRVDGADTINYGATATLTAIPAAHAVFTGWSNGETANPLNFTLEKDTTIIAIFTVDSHVISATVNVDSMGTVTGAGTYDHGKTAILTATANAHHHFVNWSNGITANTFGILVEKDSAVTANFAIDEHVLTLGVNIADAGTVTGAGTFAWNSQTVISATANEHYVFSRWSNGETANPLTINVENDTTVTAIFIVDSHIISATVNDGTMGSVSGAGTYDHGKTAILTATANDHYHFVNWDNGVTANTFGILVEKDSAVTANFEIDRHVVTTIVNDAALGSVSGAGTYNYGAIATLTATPADHAIFTGWSNGETTPTININVEGDTIVTAMFIYDSHVISANVNDETMGTVVGTGTFMHGATAILTAIPNAPYHFVNWSNGETTETIVINVTMDSTLIAYFSIDQHNVTVTVNDPDGGVATGSGTYSYGDTVMLKATANEHYSFTGWSNGETDTVIYVIVNGNIDITANFTIDQHAVNATIEGVGTVKHCGYYDYGSEAVLEAIPGDGWIFQGWDNGETSETLTITVTCDTTVHAIFVRRSSVDDTEADSYVAYAGYNEIVVTGAADHTVAVYDMNGRLVKAIDNASDIERINVNVAGVYLIRVSNMTATRVVVK